MFAMCNTEKMQKENTHTLVNGRKYKISLFTIECASKYLIITEKFSINKTCTPQV